ncbi:thioredoxin-like protein [Staphylococcus phage Twort]|uniref:ORF123 n=2 Tax=Staphylococcus phage Twort (strain DSM 17442 / HER 48) TaxID=2908167 RepID=Q4Z9A1_BPTWO|nr:thioredoxin-like protein [Staphylococcus phage Twort]AAX92412.1 ORF123 [Staphylococcus phage Twort]QIW89143.1 thioredoxin-like protein [Staphylococcus phage Twort]
MEEVKSLLDLNVQVRQKKDAIALLTQNNCGKCEILKQVIPHLNLAKPLFVLNLDGKDADREQIINHFDLMSTPVLVGYKDGELVKKFEDDVTPQQLQELEDL